MNAIWVIRPDVYRTEDAMEWYLGLAFGVLVVGYMLWVLFTWVKAGYDAWRYGTGTDRDRDGKGLWR